MAITRATKCKEVERERETQAVSVKAHTGLRFFVGRFFVERGYPACSFLRLVGNRFGGSAAWAWQALLLGGTLGERGWVSGLGVFLQD